MNLNYNTFLQKEAFDSEVKKINESNEEVYSKINTLFHENLYMLDKRSYHFIQDFLKSRTELENVFFSTVLRAVTQSEILSGNSAHLSFLYAMTLTKAFQRDPEVFANVSDTSLQGAYKKLWEDLREEVRVNTAIATPQDLKKVIRGIVENDSVLAEVIWQAINLAGIEGKIFVESGKNSSNYVVELREGYSFDLLPFNMLMKPGKPFKRHDAKIFLVDGVIEQVSEIDQLLLKAHETMQPLIIISQGFSEEVVATCKTNNEQNNFDVMPIRVKPDIHSLNQMNDIGVVCGTVPLSALTGQMLSLIKWEELPSVPEISITSKETTIINASTQGSVASHIKSILKRKNESNSIDDVQTIYDKRLKTLVSNSVVIQLPNMDLISNDSIRIKLDLALRNIKTVLNYGIVDIGAALEAFEKSSEDNDTIPLNKELKKIMVEAIKQSKKDIRDEHMSSLGFLTSVLLIGKSLLLFLNSSGCVITV